jgi:hypothetical protein
MAVTNRRPAYAEHPVVSAVIQGTIRVPTREKALHWLNILRTQFVISRAQEDATESANPTECVRLWIRGYALTEEDIQAGFRGHFALVRIVRLDSEHYTLVAEKLDMPLQKHPQKQRPPRKHPDWGHPILRAIRKGKVYETGEKARAELQRLAEEFPTISIRPNPDKLCIVVYTKRRTPPIEKIILRVVPTAGGEFTLDISENTRPARHEPGPGRSLPTEEKKDGLRTEIEGALRMTAPEERALLDYLFRWGNAQNPDESWLVHLVWPAQDGCPPWKAAWTRAGKPHIRFLRLPAPVQTPMAVLTRAVLVENRMRHDELTLHLSPEGQWTPWGGTGPPGRFPSSPREGPAADLHPEPLRKDRCEPQGADSRSPSEGRLGLLDPLLQRLGSGETRAATAICTLANSYRHLPERGDRAAAALLENWLDLRLDESCSGADVQAALWHSPLGRVSNPAVWATVLGLLASTIRSVPGRRPGEAVVLLEGWLGLEPEHFVSLPAVRAALLGSPLREAEPPVWANVLFNLADALRFVPERGPGHSALLLEAWLGLEVSADGYGEELQAALGRSPLVAIADRAIWCNLLALLAATWRKVPRRGARAAVALLEGWLGLDAACYRSPRDLAEELRRSPLGSVENANARVNIVKGLAAALIEVPERGQPASNILLEGWLGSGAKVSSPAEFPARALETREERR